MLRYFYKWTPLVIVGTIVFLSLPWLGLIALLLVALVALPALAIAIFVVPYMLFQAVRGRWQGHAGAEPAVARSVAATQSLRPEGSL